MDENGTYCCERLARHASVAVLSRNDRSKLYVTIHCTLTIHCTFYDYKLHLPTYMAR